ncbi:hypothetical protein M9435_004364 [Picochlorum sp. BPE23]|nr:hypothetical protein M9435_004364 [Picochlorum sp. BPE23]
MAPLLAISHQEHVFLVSNRLTVLPADQYATQMITNAILVYKTQTARTTKSATRSVIACNASLIKTVWTHRFPFAIPLTRRVSLAWKAVSVVLGSSARILSVQQVVMPIIHVIRHRNHLSAIYLLKHAHSA